MKKTIIEEWHEKIESVSRAIIRCILKNYADTTKVRIIIIQEPLKEDKVLQTTVKTYDDNEQNFKFYIKELEDITEICIYEQTMSRKNAGKIMIIEEKNTMISLDNKKTKGYEDSIVGFLLANIEWK